MWASNLSLTGDVVGKLHSCGAAFSTLVGLVNGRILPLPMAVELFDLKVDAIMSGSRWLWLSTPDAQQKVDDFLDRCARCLLDADPWRNGHIIRGELGWHLSGWQRVQCDAICRYARIQKWDDDDLYLMAARAAEHIPES